MVLPDGGGWGVGGDDAPFRGAGQGPTGANNVQVVRITYHDSVTARPDAVAFVGRKACPGSE
eukprot:1316865-Rhodomonas_salina.5